ncbi:MAG: 16S rRNA (uracil(1498)-N(3))-methyltransferase [Deltaproteobacteria bacterium]|nr:16S rRNA (uracil(1498)-N(3))-methyltransferase [Deltaproteobacteria bacterium]
MNLILLFKDDFTDGDDRVRLDGRRLKHVLEVHRAKAGDELCVGLEGGGIGTGTVTHIDRDVLEMDVALKQRAPAPLPLTLVLALPRPKALRRILSSASAIGVKKIFLVNSYRVEKSFWQSPFLNEGHIKKQLFLGLEQAKDTILPEVFLRSRFKPFVEDELPDISKGTIKLVAHPTASAQCPRDTASPVTLVIGPEGGFIPYEIETLGCAGFSAISLGERILSVETAVPFLISRLF